MDNQPNTEKIYIIILNWNGLADTLECLESLGAIDYPDFDVVVVDNGSHDDSCREIRSRYPNVHVLENRENLGFAEGNNVGIRYAIEQGAGYVFLLNNDTSVDPHVLTELMRAANRFGGAGVFGPVIYYHAEPERIWCAGATWSPLHGHAEHVTDRTPDDVAETGYVCGCALFISTAIVHKIGLMDARFFLTFEEADWCYRAARAGFKSYCVPRARIWHKISASFGGSSSPVISYFLARNALLWAERNLNPWKHIRMIWLTLRKVIWLSSDLSDNVRTRNRVVNAMAVLSGQFSGTYPTSLSRAYYLGLRDYLFRRFGNCPEEVRRLGEKRV
jgi:GT2 family glycosyltransferase